MAPRSHALDMVLEHDEDNPSSGPSLVRRFFPYRPTDPDLLPAWSRRVSMLAFGMMQNALAGGLIFGWSAIDQSVLAEPLESGGAGLKLQQSAQIFSWATSVSMVAALVLGAILDHAGPRIASMLSCVTVSLGCLIFSVSNKMPGFALGTIMIGFGGPGIGNGIIHLANLFPGNQNLVMSCLSGSIAFSFSTFAVFDSIWSAYHPWLTFRHLFAVYAVIMLLLALGAVILYPDEAYEELIDGSVDEMMDDSERGSYSESTPLTNEMQQDHLHHRHGHAPICVSLVSEQPVDSFLRDKHRMYKRTESYRASSKSLARGGPPVSLKDRPLKDQITSGAYVRAFLVFCTTCFLTNFYVGSLSMELKDRANFSTQVQHDLARWFTVLMGFGIFGSLLVGWLIDRVGLEICTSMTLVLGQLQTVLVVFGSTSESLMILSFTVYTVFRAFLYPVFISSLTTRLGFKYFGILLGIGFALSGVTQLLFPLLISLLKGNCHVQRNDDAISNDCDHGRWPMSEVLQFLVLGMMHIIPFLDHQDTIARERSIKEILLSSPLVKSTYGSSQGTATAGSPNSHES